MNTPLPHPGGWRAAAGVLSIALFTLCGLAFFASYHFHEAIRWDRVRIVLFIAVMLLWLGVRPERKP